MKQVLIAVFSLIMVGCEKKQPTASVQPSPRTLPAIQKIIAEQLKRSPNDLRPDATFASLGADDLDLVEIVMATEEALNISIDDDGLTKAAHAANPDKLVGSLTIQAFAAFADGAPRQTPSKNNEPNDGGLRATQVGSFAELSKLPNPRGHELVFIPSIEERKLASEQKLGRKMTSEEQADLKANAVVMALPREHANQLRQKRLEHETSK